jgi:ribosomal protein S18 acetylase RimI-like enzyme
VLRVEIRELQPEELAFGAGVAARGLRDNPSVVAVLGEGAVQRERYMTRTFGAYLPRMKHPPLGAWRDDYVVGVCGMAPPGTCQLPALQQLAMFGRIRPTNPAMVRRTFTWLADWASRDPDEPHWHLGPVAVEGGMRGMAIGTQLMEEFIARMDRERTLAYLETDKPDNVVFYERFGFEVSDESELLGAPNWFMRREPA